MIKVQYNRSIYNNYTYNNINNMYNWHKPDVTIPMNIFNYMLLRLIIVW